MNVKKICLFSLLILFLILSTSSIHAHDLNNSTDLNPKIQDNIISDENSFGDSIFDDEYFNDVGEWTLDENGNIVTISSNKTPSESNYSTDTDEKNVTDLRNNNSESTNQNQFPQITEHSSMLNLWKKYINDPWAVVEKYNSIPDNTPTNWENYVESNNPCNKHYSKEFIEFLNFVNENKAKPASIESKNSNVFYSKNNKYTVKILNPISDSVGKGINVTFVFNGKKIKVKTDENGYASFKLNSQPGNYVVKIYAGNITSKNKITVKPLFKTNNINKIYKKSKKFTIKIIKQKGRSISKQIVKITFKGKNYKIKTNSQGIAIFNIPKNLKIGKYIIKTSYNGCSVKNKITVIH